MKERFNTYIDSMILSASGWRMIFSKTDNEEDTIQDIGSEKEVIAYLIGQTFAQYMKGILKEIEAPPLLNKKTPLIAVGMDARPTGNIIAKKTIQALVEQGIDVQFLGITAAPEIMAWARNLDGFLYISASHNPIGHNGIKFGLSDGGVIPGKTAAALINQFKKLSKTCDPCSLLEKKISIKTEQTIKNIFEKKTFFKKEALNAYKNFTLSVITGEDNPKKQKKAFIPIADGLKNLKAGIVCDMNGSARTLSIDSAFLSEFGIDFHPINNEAGKIAHAIIPEPENLIYCANEMEILQQKGNKHFILGYMPDCDGDRGNIVYWNEKSNKACVLKAQEVFSLSVLSELAYSSWKEGDTKKRAISVNGPTSMRIDDISKAFNAVAQRAEVGEANVVNKARELRKNGYEVRILGEGSNGGNITHPAAVRDPMNTIFALLKLLIIRDTMENDTLKKGLFHLWCKKSGQENAYKKDFTLVDIIETLPVYATTGVSEKRAILTIKTSNHAVLKQNFQKIFKQEWAIKKEQLKENYGFTSFTAIASNGTNVREESDFSVSKKGGLKIIFKNEKKENLAYMWMRGSGTEPVFRILCDVKAKSSQQYDKDRAVFIEKELLEWETAMLKKADFYR